MRRVQLPWFFLIVLFANAATAQVPDPTTAAQAPMPGSDHSYIGIGAETVNPADGMLSFDLPVKTPPGRGLSFPFGIRYNGAEPYYVGGAWGSVAWQKIPAGAPNEFGGWSYKLPAYTAHARVISTHQAFNQPPGVFDRCDGTDSYVFLGFEGIQQNVSVNNLWPDINNFYPSGCTSGGNSGGSGGFGTRATLGTVAPELNLR